MICHTMSFVDVVFVFLAEEFDTTGDGTGRGVAERTERFAADIIAYIHQQIDVAHLAMAVFDALQDFG